MVAKSGSAKDKMYKEVLLYELITTLSFSKNKMVTDKTNKEYQLLQSIKDGNYKMNLTEFTPGTELAKFLTGLMLFGFYIYENIGRRQLIVTKKDKSSMLNILFFDGDSVTFDAQKYDKSLEKFLAKSLKVLLGMDDKIIRKEVFEKLSSMFVDTNERLQKEVTYLEKITGAKNLALRVTSRSDFSINMFAIVFASLPIGFLNSFFMLAGNRMSKPIEVQTVNGVKIDAGSYFAYDTIDMQELSNKIKVLLIIYQNDRNQFFALLEDAEIKEYLGMVFKDSSVIKQVGSHISDTLDGQYRPRIDMIKAFLKIIG